MALRAGRVGVNPRIVDNNGNIKGLAGDSYTKTETDALLAAKADQSDLKANGKKFVFAYSGGRYGYRAGASGDFTPFSRPGWNRPGDLEDATLVFTNITAKEGGYAVNNGYVNVDLNIEVNDTSNNVTISAPFLGEDNDSITYMVYVSDVQGNDVYIANGSVTAVQNGDTFTLTISPGGKRYIHIWGSTIF